MTLKLFGHPLSSYAQKALIAFYESGVAFELVLPDPRDEAKTAAFRKASPMGKIPALRDDARDVDLWESTIIVEYLVARFPAAAPLIPADADAARTARLYDRFYDLYVQAPTQKSIHNWMRPAEKRDAFGADEALAQLKKAYAHVDAHMAGKTWAIGDAFTLADCSAAPALLLAQRVLPLGEDFPRAAAYLDRLKQRPSVARVLKEAEPYLKQMPTNPARTG